MIWLLNSWFWKKIKKCNTSLKTTNSTGWPLLFYKFVRFRQDKYLFWLDWQKWSFDWKGYRIVGICTIRSFIFQGPTPKICCSQFEEGNCSVHWHWHSVSTGTILTQCQYGPHSNFIFQEHYHSQRHSKSSFSEEFSEICCYISLKKSKVNESFITRN